MKRFTAPLLLAGLLLLVTPVLATAHCGTCGAAEAAGKTECAKPCPTQAKADCKTDCAKPCCAKAKADCRPECAKTCCVKAKADCRPECAKHCCAKAPACDKSEQKRDSSRRNS